MNTMEQIKKIIVSLKDINHSVATKLHNYSNLRDILHGKLTKEDVKENEDTLRCLLDCIKSDVVSENADLRQSVLTILKLLCKCAWRKIIIQDLTDICIHVTFDDVTKDKNDALTITLDCLQCLLHELILQNNCDPEKLLLKVSKDVARKKVIELLEKACRDVPVQENLLFFYETVVPEMFNTPHADVRGFLVELVFASLSQFEITLLSSEKLEKFKISTKKIYVARTIELLESGDPHWNNLWIFLVRCHGKRLPSSSDVVNALLKVVEVAFRSRVMEYNVAAYNCWRELIDVYSLNQDHMCNPKYMRLLILPLRNNALKSPQLTKKRFDVWIHLIDIMKGKSFELYTRPFLEFCFGPLGESPLIGRGNPKFGSPARNNSELWERSAEALLEIIGHYEHDARNSCMVFTNNPVLKEEKPLVTANNFMSLDYIIINSVGECCSLMLNEIDKQPKREVYIKVITCLWGSLFSIIEQLEKASQENAIQRVTALLAAYIELSDEKQGYFEYILKPLFELLSDKKLFNIDVPRFNTQLLFPLLKRFLKNNDEVFLNGRKTIVELLRCSKNTHNKNSWLQEAFEIFIKSDVSKGNIKGLLSFWVDCTDVLNDICEFPTAQTEKVVQGVGIGFMVWPVLNIYQLTPEQATIVTEFTQKWGSTFASMLKTYTKESLTILMDIQKSVETSPLIASHVAQVFPGFRPLLVTEPNHKFVMTLLSLTSRLLNVPTVTKEVKNFLLPTLLLIMDYFIQETEKATKYSDFQHMCGCFEHTLHLHKEYSILEPLNNYFDKIPKSFKENVPQSLRKVVDALKTHPDKTISQKARQLSSTFIVRPVDSTSKIDSTFLQSPHLQSSRAAKITNMAITTCKSPKADNPEETSTVLRLFGHKVDSSSPVRIRGSHINNSNNPQKRKAANVFPELKKSQIRVDDEEASFVLIDDPYHFDPTKLSEHQREVMKKRRSDIPALYQDLSQSQSNSQCSVDIKTIGDNQNKVEKNNEEKETKVEVVNKRSTSEFKNPNEHIQTAAKKTNTNVTVPETVSQQNGNAKECEELGQKKLIDNAAVEKTTSEELFQTQDVVIPKIAVTSNSSEKKENRDRQHVGNEPVVSLQNKSANSQPEKSDECKSDEKEVNKSLKVVVPKIGESVSSSNDEKEETLPTLNQLMQAPRRGRPRILKPRKLYNQNSEKKVKPSDSNGTSSSSNEFHENDISDLKFENDTSVMKDKEINSDATNRIDLKIQNPSMKKIEAMITEDTPSSNYSQGFLSVLLKQNNDETFLQEDVLFKQNVASDKQLLSDVNEENKNQDSLSDEEKKRLKIMKELNKIKMDIVGGDAFVRNLNLTERVRTRRSVGDAATLTLRSGSRINYDSDDSKSSSSSDSSRKSKLRATVKIVDKLSKDKLALSPKSSNKLRQSVIPSSPKSNSKSHNDNTCNDAKLSPTSRKIIAEDHIDVGVGKNNTFSDKPIRRRRISVTLGEPIHSGEESMSPSRRKARSDKNWIAEVNKCLEDCVKPSRVITRKSSVNILDSPPKTKTSDSKNISKISQVTEKLSKAEHKLPNNSEFTVTLLSKPECQNSEDVIESSQESFIEIKPCQKSINSGNSVDSIQNLNLEINEVVTNLRKRKVQTSSSVSLVIENRADNLKLMPNTNNSGGNNTDCGSEEIKSKDLKDSLSTFSPDELMRMDLTSHIITNQNDTCEMDTETLDLIADTPTKSVSIPTSPVKIDTPTRTSELINNTLNISPIKLVPRIINRENSSEKTLDLFDSDPCTSNKSSEDKLEHGSLFALQDSQTKPDSPPEDSVPSTAYQLVIPSCSTVSDKANQRSLKLLRMVSYNPSPESQKIQKTKQASKPFISSPKTHRIIKMMQTFEKKEPEGTVGVVEVEDPDEEPKKLILEKDILEFVRELPSPMASPRYSILKRKAPDSKDEGLSPPRKKRVNFSDPPTTCEKVFFKDKNEHHYGKKDNNEYNEDTGYENNTNIQEMENIATLSNNAGPPVLEKMEYVEPPILEAVKSAPTSITINKPNVEPLNIEQSHSEKETESLNVETQGSVDVTNPFLLECTLPILPELTDCKESIHNVIGKMTSPIFVSTLAEELKHKNIFTIGDLAKLSEMEVSRLAFRAPKVLVVRSTLRKFMSQKSNGIETKVVDKSTIKEVKSSSTKTEDIDNNDEQKGNNIKEVEPKILIKEKTLVQSHTDKSTNIKIPDASSDSPNVKIVSSIILQPARVTSQTKTDKSPRRVPLIKVTSSNTPTCSTFTQAESVVTAKVAPSGAKNCKTVIFGNVEEREKLRIRIPELIADFEEMREKVKRQGLSTTSLYELIIEIVGTENFVSILQDNEALSINHFVKSNNWCTLIAEIVHNIGLSKIVSCLCDIPKVTPLKIVDSIIDHIITNQGKNRSSLEKIAHHALKNVALSNILKKFGMRCIVDTLCAMNKSSEFTVEDFFQHATFRFSPSLDEMVPSFRNINIVRLSNEAMQLSNCNKKDLGIFVKKIGNVVEDSTLSEICKSPIAEGKDIVRCIPDVKKEEVMHILFNEMPLPKQEEAVIATVDKMSNPKQEELVCALYDKISSEKQKELAFSMFAKMSDLDAYDCFTSFFRKRLQKT